MPNLFERKTFVMHSGAIGRFKIECDALTQEDIDCLAFLIAERFTFSKVVGVPSSKGGIDNGRRLQIALEPYADFLSESVLIVDDVLTTGGSMKDEYARQQAENPGADIIGVVIFARSDTNTIPHWVHPMWLMWGLR